MKVNLSKWYIIRMLSISEASQLPQKNSNTETTPVSTPINKTKLEGYENGGSPTKVKQGNWKQNIAKNLQ